MFVLLELTHCKALIQLILSWRGQRDWFEIVLECRWIVWRRTAEDEVGTSHFRRHLWLFGIVHLVNELITESWSLARVHFVLVFVSCWICLCNLQGWKRTLFLPITRDQFDRLYIDSIPDGRLLGEQWVHVDA